MKGWHLAATLGEKIIEDHGWIFEPRIKPSVFSGLWNGTLINHRMMDDWHFETFWNLLKHTFSIRRPIFWVSGDLRGANHQWCGDSATAPVLCAQVQGLGGEISPQGTALQWKMPGEIRGRAVAGSRSILSSLWRMKICWSHCFALVMKKCTSCPSHCGLKLNMFCKQLVVFSEYIRATRINYKLSSHHLRMDPLVTSSSSYREHSIS